MTKTLKSITINHDKKVFDNFKNTCFITDLAFA